MRTFESVSCCRPARIARLRPALALAGILCLLGLPVRAGIEWKVLKGKHFLIYYTGPKDSARAISARAETLYRQIRQDLGFSKHGDFWLWDKRATIRVYPNRMSYVLSTGAPLWSAGRAAHATRTIATFRSSESFLDYVLPHELTHLVFRDYVGFDQDVPMWLNEGIAQWRDESVRKWSRPIVCKAHAEGVLIPLAELVELDEASARRVGRVRLAYAQSVSIVEYLIDTYGMDRFQTLCRHLRGEKDVSDALRFTYPRNIRSVEDLERAWKQYLEDIR